MPVLGILACEILELEFAHLLAGDPDLAVVTVVAELGKVPNRHY